MLLEQPNQGGVDEEESDSDQRCYLCGSPEKKRKLENKSKILPQHLWIAVISINAVEHGSHPQNSYNDFTISYFIFSCFIYRLTKALIDLQELKRIAQFQAVVKLCIDTRCGLDLWILLRSLFWVVMQKGNELPRHVLLLIDHHKNQAQN